MNDQNPPQKEPPQGVNEKPVNLPLAQKEAEVLLEQVPEVKAANDHSKEDK